MPSDPFTRYVQDLGRQLRGGHAGERSYYPALQGLLESLDRRLRVTSEPAGIRGASVDFLIRRGQRTVGHIEAKDIGSNLDEIQESEQLLRYRERFPNLILTDFLEFRHFLDGERRATARLGHKHRGRIKVLDEGPSAVRALIGNFLAHRAPGIGEPAPLARRLARLTHELRDLIIATFAAEKQAGHLHAQLEAFREVLIHDLTAEQFADMYAQTVTYGLFAARAQNPGQAHFSRKTAVFDLPKTNPFLRQLFGAIAGPELDHEVAWLVDDLADVIGQADFSEILKDFGRRTRQEDPVVHFYETFLAAYDPDLREKRGVYYTPEPVVSYITRSVHHVLRSRFGKRKGLAEEDVFILDPACGTGTFLYFVIRQIHDELFEAGQGGTFSAYVAKHLLPRVFGFELLMAPYAVCHMKLGIELKDLGYTFASDERLGIYLTNTLEEAQRRSENLWARWITAEANAAAEVKRDRPILVVLGNPPWAGHSANASWVWKTIGGKRRKHITWIGRQLKPYFQVDGKPLGEKNPKWLQDDYVKFIRFGQWRIEQTGEGVLAFVTNHAYLDNPTFRGMRQSLMETFDDIYVLNLHGNSRKRETCPDGSTDENVFDIQQGVAIGIFVKDGSRQGQPAAVHYADLWGTREAKQAALFSQDLSATAWTDLEPESPYYLFVPWNTSRWAEYEKGWKVTDAFPVNSVGIVTARDALTIHFTPEEAWNTVTDFSSLDPEEARAKYDLGKDVRDWKVHLAQADIHQSGPDRKNLVPILYRPFDVRHTYYTGRTKGFHCMPRRENLAISSTRSTEIQGPFQHVFCTRLPIQHHTVSLKEVNYLFPLYLYPRDQHEPGTQGELGISPWPAGPGGRRPNLDPHFVEEFAGRLGMTFLPDGAGDRRTTFGPEDIFHYAYAIFHAPTFRERYEEFLRVDFPRLPLTSDADLFRRLCSLGADLVALHLLESPALENFVTTYPACGDHLVASGHPRYMTPEEVKRHTDGKAHAGRVYINPDQYFEGVPPDVWALQIGGYQVAEKWLKDRRGRNLTLADLQRYQQIIVALAETIRLMAEIDAAIPAWPIR